MKKQEINGPPPSFFFPREGGPPPKLKTSKKPSPTNRSRKHQSHRQCAEATANRHSGLALPRSFGRERSYRLEERARTRGSGGTRSHLGSTPVQTRRDSSAPESDCRCGIDFRARHRKSAAHRGNTQRCCTVNAQRDRRERGRPTPRNPR